MKKILILSHCLLNNLCENPPAPEMERLEIKCEILADITSEGELIRR